MIDLTGNTGRTLLGDALAQDDVDMNHFKLLNLDTSNLPISAAPPTIAPVAHLWLKSWDNPSRTWGVAQIDFSDLSGQLSTGVGGQQQHISQLGVVTVGVWQAAVIAAPYLPTLDAIRLPVTNLSMNSFRIGSLGNPVSNGDAMNLGYFMSILPGLKIKEAVKCATTVAIGLVDFPVIDGYHTVAGDRVLIKDMTGSLEYLNGIWIARAGNWTSAPISRSTDADTADELTLATTFVLNGAVNGGTTWVEANALTGIGVGFPVHFVILTNSAFAPPGPPGHGVPVGGLINQVLAKASGADYDTHWVNAGGGLGTPPPVYSHLQTTATGNLTGTNSTTPVLMGLAALITPQTSGKLVVTIAGYAWNNSVAANTGATVQLCVGSGVAPHNGSPPPVGTSAAFGAVEIVSHGVGIAGTILTPFSVSAIITGITPGNQVWCDLLVSSPTGGTAIAAVGGVSVTAYEVP